MVKDHFQYYFRLLTHLVVLCLALLGVEAKAQEPDVRSGSTVKDYVDFDLEIANNHLWRGIEVSDGLIMRSTLALHDKQEFIKVGIWGGSNTSGYYKELNFFAEFKYQGWKLALWDTYNFSSGADYNNQEFFNYKARDTGRFLDCNLSYHFGRHLPLILSWSTILWGRDRYNLYQADAKNRYSTFVYGEYKLYDRKDWRFDVGAGGTFVLNRREGESSTFYSHKAGIIHLQIRLQHLLKVTSDYKLPVFALVMFNPVEDRAFFQIGAQLFKF